MKLKKRQTVRDLPRWRKNVELNLKKSDLVMNKSKRRCSRCKLFYLKIRMVVKSLKNNKWNKFRNSK
jgi:hypothetical protein